MFFFFFNDTAPPEIYTLPLHDALPISGTRLIDAMRDLPRVCKHMHLPVQSGSTRVLTAMRRRYSREDRKSTRLNSSHLVISYAVFCLKKKKQKHRQE